MQAKAQENLEIYYNSNFMQFKIFIFIIIVPENFIEPD